MRLTGGFRYLIVLGCLLALSVPILAQSGRGNITGTVTDSSGGVVPGAEITAVNMAAGGETKTVTTDVGYYRIPFVEPGKYKVSVSLAGFKTAVHENVDVMVTQTVTVDFVMTVGDLADQVTVSSEAPLLEKSTSEIGTAASELEVHTWPILVGDGTRQLQSFIFRAMPGTQGDEWNGSVNGGQGFAHEILIDGISIGRFDLNGGSNSEFTPTMDAVSEFKLQTGATSAQYGNSQTGLTNFAMKGGTNQYHGTAFWFVQNEAFNANSWGNNAAGRPKAVSRLNNFGFSFGGPVIKDKTHFFFSYEGNRQTNYNISNPTGDSLPVAPFKQGDFSLLLDPAFTADPRSGTVVGTDGLGRNILFGAIYDPATSRQLPSGAWIRDPFPGNIISPNRMSAVTHNILRYDLPEPVLFRLRNNNPRVGSSSPELNVDNYSFKVDHVMNEQHKLGTSFVYNNRTRLRYGAGGYYYMAEPRISEQSPLAGDKQQYTPGYIIRVTEDWTLTPMTLNHFAVGYNRFRNANQSLSYLDGRNWAQDLGLQNVGGAAFPTLNFGGLNSTLTGSYRTMGHSGTGNEPNGSVIVSDDITLIRGSHSFRVGGEHRRYYINSRFVDTPGSYSFNNENTALPGFSSSTGFTYASFFLGEVRNSSVGVNRLTQGVRSRTTAFYVQDDWKVRPNLTLNLGFRWDIPQPFTESKNSMSALNPLKPNPGADGLPGALEFLGTCPVCNGQKSFGKMYWKEFSPRIGFAWSMNQKTVLRGGYGINYAPPILDGWNYGWFNGFDGSIPITVRSRSRFNEDASWHWDGPYPSYAATLPNYDPAQMNGSSIPYYPNGEAPGVLGQLAGNVDRMPMTQNWNFGFQYELPWQTRLEANYVGTKGTRLSDGYLFYLNQLDPKYLSLGATLLDDIGDHPEITKPYPSFEGTVAQALRPFPQFYGISAHRLASGWSNYHSLQMTMTKRAASGLSFLVSYTFSKSLGTANTAIGYYNYGQDIYNRAADYSVTGFNVPHDLRVTWIYELPIGPNGRWLRSGPLSNVIGGWTMSAIQHYRSGGPLSVSSGGYESEALFNTGFKPDVVSASQKIGGQPTSVDNINGTPYLNPDAFAPLPLFEGTNIPTHLGNAPRYLPNVRGFKQFSEDFSMLKRVGLGITEDTALEIRLDAINLLNRIGISGPETDVNDPERFGRTFGKSGGPRTIQLGLRVSF